MFVLIATLLGAAVGSFLTVIVERFERGEGFVSNRSYCESCKKELRWWELVPVVSFLLVRGKCARCRAPIPQHLFWFELITALVFGLVAWLQPMGWAEPFFYADLVIISSLLLLFFYDARHQVFLGVHLVISAVLVAVVTIILGVVLGNWLVLRDALIGGMLGMTLLGALAVPSGGRWMGYGDVLLVGIIGLWIGYPLIIVALVVAFYVGAFVGVTLMLTKRVGKDHRIAFGPFLILGAIVAHIWGNALFHAILQLWGG